MVSWDGRRKTAKKVTGKLLMTYDDFVGNSIEVGDYVALSQQSNTTIIYGIVTKMSVGKTGKLSVCIEIDGAYGIKTNVYRVPHNVIKIDKSVIAEKVLTKVKKRK